MALEIAALTTATAKLIALGVEAATALEHPGWGADEARLFGDALGSVPAFSAVVKTKADDQRSPLQAYCELVTIAFGKAWRRHWAENETLAPTRSKRFGWFTSMSTRARMKQLEEALHSGCFADALGSATPLAEVALLDSLSDPITSPWFRALWAALWAEDESGENADSSLPPLLLWQVNQEGASRREFERHLRVAFFEGLSADNYRALRAWLLTRPQEQARLLRIMLAVRLSSFRNEHIFGTYEEGLLVPLLPLKDIYVEPDARRLHVVHGRLQPSQIKEPVLALLNAAMAEPQATIFVVLADFGRGKSLTARTLAWQLADRFLDEPTRTSPELAFPIFVRCELVLFERTPWERLASRVESDGDEEEAEAQTVHGRVQGGGAARGRDAWAAHDR